MNTPKNVIDYFATLGRALGPLKCKSLSSVWNDSNAVLPSDVWLDAITDITIVLPYDGTPDNTWQLIGEFYGGLPVNCNLGEFSKPLAYLAVRRRRDFDRLDHISQIQIGLHGEPCPEGFEPLENSIGGIKLSNLYSEFQLSMIYIKRSNGKPEKWLLGDPLIDYVCIFVHSSKNADQFPEGFVVVENPLNRGSTSDKAILMYHARPPLGICDLPYESVTLDRYPSQDHDGLALPTQELPLFAFPHDLRLRCAPLQNYPLPDLFTFVFTDAKGSHLYAACLRFYETVPAEDIQDLMREVYGVDEASPPQSLLPVDLTVFSPKVICVISRLPFYRAMQRYLRQLYSLSLSPSRCPIESYIASIVSQVPVPLPGGRPFYVCLDAALITSNSRAMSPIIFELPDKKFFPPIDLDFSGPLRCLSVENVLAVFSLMLKEAKILFICCSNALLTEVMETFRKLLFPMSWSFAFIPRLPDAFSTILEAPGGYMVGLHMLEDDVTDPESPRFRLDVKPVGKRRYTRQRLWTHSMQSGTYVVDLTENTISVCENHSSAIPAVFSATSSSTSSNRKLVLRLANVPSLLKLLPPFSKKKLQTKLEDLSKKFGLGPNYRYSNSHTGFLQRFDSAFDYVDPDTAHNMSAGEVEVDDEGEGGGAGGRGGAKRGSFPTTALRMMFMDFMADLLGNYQKHILPPMFADTEAGRMSASSAFRTLEDEFDVESYLSAATIQLRPFLRSLVHTQMFAVFLQSRAEEVSFPLIFFERVTSRLRSLKYRLNTDGRQRSDSSDSSAVDRSSLPALSAMRGGTSQRTQRHGGGAAGGAAVNRDGGSGGGDIKTSDDSPPRVATTSTASAAVVNYHKERKQLHHYWPEETEEIDWDENSCLFDLEELGKCDQPLKLHDRLLGPLVIPGPNLMDYFELRNNSNVSVGNEDVESRYEWDKVDGGKLFVYSKNWPVLDTSILFLSRDAAALRLRRLCDQRLISLTQVDLQVSLMPRSLSEQSLSLLLSSAQSVRSTDSAKGSQKTPFHQTQTQSHKGQYSDSSTAAAVKMVSECYSASLLLLSLRVVRRYRAGCDIMQAAGILGHLESQEMLCFLDEGVWRSLLLACSSVGGTLMRHVSCVLFDVMRVAGVVADAMTYAVHARSLAASDSFTDYLGTAEKTDEEREPMYLDAFVYLEEVGSRWLLERVVGGLGSLPTECAIDLEADRTAAAATRRGEISGRRKSTGWTMFAERPDDRKLKRSSLLGLGVGLGVSADRGSGSDLQYRKTANSRAAVKLSCTKLGLVPGAGLFSLPALGNYSPMVLSPFPLPCLAPVSNSAAAYVSASFGCSGADTTFLDRIRKLKRRVPPTTFAQPASGGVGSGSGAPQESTDGATGATSTNRMLRFFVTPTTTRFDNESAVTAVTTPAATAAATPAARPPASMMTSLSLILRPRTTENNGTINTSRNLPGIIYVTPVDVRDLWISLPPPSQRYDTQDLDLPFTGNAPPPQEIDLYIRIWTASCPAYVRRSKTGFLGLQSPLWSDEQFSFPASDIFRDAIYLELKREHPVGTAAAAAAGPGLSTGNSNCNSLVSDEVVGRLQLLLTDSNGSSTLPSIVAPDDLPESRVTDAWYTVYSEVGHRVGAIRLLVELRLGEGRAVEADAFPPVGDVLGPGQTTESSEDSQAEDDAEAAAAMMERGEEIRSGDGGTTSTNSISNIDNSDSLTVTTTAADPEPDPVAVAGSTEAGRWGRRSLSTPDAYASSNITSMVTRFFRSRSGSAVEDSSAQCDSNRRTATANGRNDVLSSLRRDDDGTGTGTGVVNGVNDTANTKLAREHTTENGNGATLNASHRFIWVQQYLSDGERVREEGSHPDGGTGTGRGTSFAALDRIAEAATEEKEDIADEPAVEPADLATSSGTETYRGEREGGESLHLSTESIDLKDLRARSFDKLSDAADCAGGDVAVAPVPCDPIEDVDDPIVGVHDESSEYSEVDCDDLGDAAERPSVCEDERGVCGSEGAVTDQKKGTEGQDPRLMMNATLTSTTTAPAPPPPTAIVQHHHHHHHQQPISELEHLQCTVKTLSRCSAAGGRAVSIHCHCPCPCCGFLPLDEEVLSQWAAHPSVSVFGGGGVSPGSTPSPSGSGREPPPSGVTGQPGETCNYTCLQCVQSYNPQLYIRCFERATAAASSAGGDAADSSIIEIWALEVSYISPYALRVSLEDAVRGVGDVAGDASWLCLQMPVLFWNLLWFAARLNIPPGCFLSSVNPYETTLPTTSSSSSSSSSTPLRLDAKMLSSQLWSGPVLCAFRSGVAKSKVESLLLDGAGKRCDRIRLTDIFPGLEEAQVAQVVSLSGELDGTFSGMRRAILVIHGLVGGSSSSGSAARGTTVDDSQWSVSRRIYISLLSLVHYFQSPRLLIFPDDLKSGMDKGIYFDRIYTGTINNALSPEDFSRLGVTSMELLGGVSDPSVQAVRLGFGFML